MATEPALSIVVVEDHDILREEIVSYLQRPAWQVRGVDCGEDMDAVLRIHAVDVIVLDLNLPHEDGLSIARRLRSAMPSMGIVMLSARQRPSDRTSGYTAGADIYLTKPTNILELESVIHNLGRRLVPDVPKSGLSLTGSILRNISGEVSLTARETALIGALAVAPDRRLRTDMLLERLGLDSEDVRSRETLTVLVSRLHLKLETVLQEAHLLKALRGFGYALERPVLIK